MRSRSTTAAVTLHLTVFALVLAAQPVLAQNPVPVATGTDWDLSSGALDGSKLVIAGEFVSIGRPCGSWVSFDLATGAANDNGAVVSGQVFEAIPDGSGGFFLGGRVHGVDGSPRQGLAHIRGDGSVDPWAPTVDGAILALALKGDTLFVSGAFSQVNGAPRGNLAALDANTGALLAWNVPANAEVDALDVVDDTLYVGGWFRFLGSESRPSGIGAIDVRTVTVTPWTLELGAYQFAHGTPYVSRIVHDGSRLYVGGDFKSVGAVEASGFAVIDRSSGALLSPAYMCCGGAVTHVLVHGGRVYVSGSFNVSNPAGSCNGVMAISRTTLQPVAWAPAVPRTLRWGGAIAASGDRVFVSEEWRDQTHFPEPLSVVDTATGQQLAFPAPLHATGGSRAFAIEGGRLYAGGPFRLTSSTPRQSIAELTLPTGAWSPRTFGLLPGEVALQVAADGGRVFAWTSFAKLVAFDAAAAPIWRRAFAGFVTMIAAHGHLIVAGRETFGGVDDGRRVFDLDPGTGVTRAWAPTFADPSGSATVRALALDDERLYAGGTFQSVSTQPTGGIVAFRWSDLALEPTSFGAIHDVSLLTAGSGRLVTLGYHDADPKLAALDAATGQLLPWDPLPRVVAGLGQNEVHGLAILDGDVFMASGASYQTPGQALIYRASLSGSTWTPEPLGGDGWASQVMSGAGRLFVIGHFTGFGPQGAAGVGMLATSIVDVPRPVEPRANTLALWPDPARDHVAIRLGRVALPARLDLMDVSGRLLRRLHLSHGQAGEFELDLAQANGRRAEPGVHFVVVTGADGVRSTARFVVVR